MTTARPSWRPSNASSTMRASIHHPIAAGDVRSRRHVTVPERAQEVRDAGRSLVRGLEAEDAARPQDVGCATRERLGHTGRDERRPRLEVTHFRLERRELMRLHVRRVRDEEVERAGEPREEVALDELDAAFEPGPRAVLRGELERARRVVGRDDARGRMLVGDRERDRARPDADVEHTRLAGAGEQLEAALDEHLRLRARDQDAAIDLQCQAPEAPLAEDVGERLAPGPPSDELPEALLVRRRELARP